MINNVVYLDTFENVPNRSFEVTEGLSKYNHLNTELIRKELQKGYMKLLPQFKNN